MQIFIWNSHFELFVHLQICTKDFGFIQFLTWFWLKFNWAHVNWSTSHEPTKILCTFLNWNLSSFSLFFFSPFISFVYFDFYLTSPLELIAHIFLLSLKCGAVIVFKCTDTWGVTPRSGGCIGTLPDRPRIVPFEVCLSRCCLYGDGQRTWAGIIQVVLPQVWPNPR